MHAGDMALTERERKNWIQPYFVSTAFFPVDNSALIGNFQTKISGAIATSFSSLPFQLDRKYIVNSFGSETCVYDKY